MPDLRFIPRLLRCNDCIDKNACVEFNGLSHDGPMFGRWDSFNDIMIIVLASIVSVSVLGQARKKTPGLQIVLP
jgi:hypothetical protein